MKFDILKLKEKLEVHHFIIAILVIVVILLAITASKSAENFRGVSTSKISAQNLSAHLRRGSGAMSLLSGHLRGNVSPTGSADALSAHLRRGSGAMSLLSARLRGNTSPTGSVDSLTAEHFGVSPGSSNLSAEDPTPAAFPIDKLPMKEVPSAPMIDIKATKAHLKYPSFSQVIKGFSGFDN
jgi:hypothetical protein